MKIEILGILVSWLLCLELPYIIVSILALRFELKLF